MRAQFWQDFFEDKLSMSPDNQYTDQQVIDLLQTDSGKAIELLFRMHYAFLCKIVIRIIPDPVFVEDLVQDVFYELWKKRGNIVITTSIRAYLKRAAINKTLNHIRSQKMKFDDEAPQHDLKSKQISSQIKLEADELQEVINQAISELPERCRIVFSLSRFEELSYQEIANSLEISIKTVENQISKALKILREKLAPYR